MTDPCGHLLRFVAFYVDSCVTLMNDTGDDHPVVACVMCGSDLTFEQFDALALKAAHGELPVGNLMGRN